MPPVHGLHSLLLRQAIGSLISLLGNNLQGAIMLGYHWMRRTGERKMPQNLLQLERLGLREVNIRKAAQEWIWGAKKKKVLEKS